MIDIKNDYARCGIKIAKKQTTNHSTTIYFDNGDIWTTVRASESARGYCCNVSYIDRSIPKDIVKCIIKPCTKAFPYRANYYGEKGD